MKERTQWGTESACYTMQGTPNTTQALSAADKKEENKDTT